MSSSAERLQRLLDRLSSLPDGPAVSPAAVAADAQWNAASDAMAGLNPDLGAALMMRGVTARQVLRDTHGLTFPPEAHDRELHALLQALTEVTARCAGRYAVPRPEPNEAPGDYARRLDTLARYDELRGLGLATPGQTVWELHHHVTVVRAWANSVHRYADWTRLNDLRDAQEAGAWLSPAERAEMRQLDAGMFRLRPLPARAPEETPAAYVARLAGLLRAGAPEPEFLDVLDFDLEQVDAYYGHQRAVAYEPPLCVARPRASPPPPPGEGAGRPPRAR